MILLSRQDARRQMGRRDIRWQEERGGAVPISVHTNKRRSLGTE